MTLFKLSLKDFLQKVETNEKDMTKSRKPLRYEESDAGFTMYLQDYDGEMLYTFVSKDFLQRFGQENGQNQEWGITMFRTQYLSKAQKIVSSDCDTDTLFVDKQVSKIPSVEEISPGTDMIEEGEDYEDFLKKNFRKWEKAIISSLENELSKNIEKSAVQKGFGTFVRTVFNTVNTLGFAEGIKRSFKKVMIKGVENAESELNIDIGVGASFDQKLNYFTQRQIDGFRIQGNTWPGIKGVTEQARNEIMDLVSTGINEQQSLSEISNSIHEYMTGLIGDEATEGRAQLIARTESNRAFNNAKLDAYKNSGVRGKKRWNAFFDNRTSKVCNFLDGQVVGLKDDFVDEKGNRYEHPPAHPNCRSVVEFVIEE